MTLPMDTTVLGGDAPQAEVLERTDESVPEVPAPEAAAPELPDRADAPVSEITERFLKVILAQVALDRIEEVHLFSPLRQGGVETGIAVIAARVPVAVAEPPSAPALPIDDVLAPLKRSGDEVGGDEGDAVRHPSMDASVTASMDVESAAVDDFIDAADALAASDVLAAADDAAVLETTPVLQIRHTVYTARYRLVQKGPERGKWEADVVAEAEAPLITVDLVVRGVQRRAGEESEIVRYSAPQLARAVRVPYPAV